MLESLPNQLCRQSLSHPKLPSTIHTTIYFPRVIFVTAEVCLFSFSTLMIGANYLSIFFGTQPNAFATMGIIKNYIRVRIATQHTEHIYSAIISHRSRDHGHFVEHSYDNIIN